MNTVYSPRKKKKRRALIFFILAGIFALTGSGTASLYSLLKDLPRPEQITQRQVSESTKIYDRTGTALLYEIHGEEKRTVVRLGEIPEAVRWATIAAEDDKFYQHRGLDWRGILRALAKNITQGNLIQGGSTITQQLVKNSLLGSERTFRRKIGEQILALMLEGKYSKDEILEMYLNQIPYGSNAYGIASASQTYFAKSVKELSLGEAAALAALPKAPTYYSPYGSRKKELLERRNWILERMAELGFSGKEEAEKAKKAAPDFASPAGSLLAPHFVFYVREYLNEKYGEEFVERGGLKVTTTLDWKLQEAAEKIVAEGAASNEKLVQAFNAALVAIDPKTGEVLSMVGSRGYREKPLPEGCKPGISCKFDPQVNVATRPRQPGSAFKPFVYATALKKGYTPETALFDAPTEFNPRCNPDGTPGPEIRDEKECYHPQNYDEKFRGPVTVRQALAQSLNVPSVKLLYLAGVEDSIKTAETFGISTLGDPQRYGLSLVLGGAEVTLLEMVSAFGAFSQEGILHPKTAILKIENSKGEILEEKKNAAIPVADTEIVRTLNSILSDNEARVPVFSPQSSLYFPGRPVAAKTGTTQDFRDAWVIGYTPSLVAGVWAGNNDNSAMNQRGLSIMVAGPIWHRFLESALSGTPPEEFTPPEKMPAEKAILRGLYRSGPAVKIDKISRKLATIYTPPELIEEISLGEVRSILSFVKKEDPLGEPPSNPYQEPQFKNWQSGIEKWLSLNRLPEEAAPKETDDLHLPEKRPRIDLIFPGGSQTSGQDLTARAPLKELTVRVWAFWPLREISLFINDELVASRIAPIISETVTFSLAEAMRPGSYRIKITAYDAVGNSETIEKEITVEP